MAIYALPRIALLLVAAGALVTLCDHLAADEVSPTAARSVPAQKASPARKASPAPSISSERWVGELGHEAYHCRRLAADRLFRHALGADYRGRLDDSVIAALRRGLHHEDTEVRIAAERVLRKIALATFDHQIAQLQNPRVAPRSLQIPGWSDFSRYGGDDLAARSLFARMALRHPGILQRLANRPIETPAQAADHNPFMVRPTDAVGWACLLADSLPATRLPLESEPGTPQLSGNRHESNRVHQSRTTQLTFALSGSATGPRLTDSGDALVVNRLIGGWLDEHPHAGSPRQRILIALKYAGPDRVARLCDALLSDPRTLPRDQVTAMLAAAAIDQPLIEEQLLNRLTDDRVAHVWQLIPSRQTKIRTEIRDVALALLLRQHGFDPREAGFAELQADPLLIYREHSLGFEVDESRAVAHRRGLRMIDRSQSDVAR